MSAALWGLCLGLGDGAFYGIARETYEVFLKAEKLNSKFVIADILKMLGIGSLIGVSLGVLLGVLVPLGYLWAGTEIGVLLDIHIYRCLVSILCAVAFNSYMFGDTINGYREIGILLTLVGFAFILLSTSFKS